MMDRYHFKPIILLGSLTKETKYYFFVVHRTKSYIISTNFDLIRYVIDCEKALMNDGNIIICDECFEHILKVPRRK